MAIHQKNNLRYGHYRVGNEVYTHKLSALIAASKNLNDFPHWYFHNHLYSKLNWLEDSPVDLDTLYQQRAKQLRDSYDYLVLSFSGGSDSWTALQAFIDSNTHLDEIFVRWPLEATGGKYDVNTNKHASNILSEWELTIRPMLDHYKKIIPNTKITIHDWSDQILTKELGDADWGMIQDHINPGSFIKFQSIGASELTAINHGKKTAIIFGVDKPMMFYKDGHVYCYFLDKVANCHAYADFDRVSELFYWSPDMPEIVHGQAREIYNHIKTNPQALALIDRNLTQDSSRNAIWNELTKSIIYKKYYQLKTFQANKSYTNVLDEVDAWMMSIKDFKYMQSWKYGLNNALKSVHPKFIVKKDAEVTGLLGFVSNNYCLGPVDPVYYSN